MGNFKRGGVVVLVAGALGLWGCNSEMPDPGTQGFQDPVQQQYRERQDPAGKSAGTQLKDTSKEADGPDGVSPTMGSRSLEGTGGSGEELGAGLADSYRAAEGTGGSGEDAGTPMAPHTGMKHKDAGM